MADGYKPRLSVELTPESSQRLRELIEHGHKRPLFQAIVNDLIRVIEKHGYAVIGGIVLRQINLEDFVDFSNSVEVKASIIDYIDDRIEYLYEYKKECLELHDMEGYNLQKGAIRELKSIRRVINENTS